MELITNLILLLSICGFSDSFNFDSEFVDVIDIGSSDKYFGYSVLLQKGKPSSVIVGAPKAFGNNRDWIRTGGVYKCNIGTHEPCEEYVIEHEGNAKKVGIYVEKKDEGLLGASLDGGENVGDTFFTCSPRWKMEVRRKIGESYLVNGICYAIQNSLNVNATGDRIMPLSIAEKQMHRFNNNKLQYYYAMGELGISIHYIKDEMEILLGAPGIFGGRGSAYYGKILEGYTLAPQPRLSKNQGIKLDGRLPNPLHISALKNDNSYLGYSVSSGRFAPRFRNLWYIAGSPRAEFLLGMVLLFEYRTYDDDDLIVHEKFSGEQVGSYFGSSVLGVSTSDDGLDDLLVGAPSYRVDIWDEGCVYFYKNTGQGSFLSPKKLLGSKIMGARFGTTMASIGDLNKDSYNDVAISAPYEEESGVVYVYLGSSYGLNTMYSQKILGRKISNSIRGFGFSLSRGLDIDQNLYNDLAIGAYKSEQVVIVKSRPVIKYVAHFNTSTTKLLMDTTEFGVDYCIQYRSPANNVLKADTDLDITLDSRAANNKVISKAIALEQNSTFCETINISLQKGHLNYINAFTIKLNYAVSKQKSESFCPLCPIVDPTEEKFITFSIPFAN